MFKQSVYAVDNCDATSICFTFETGTRNSQNNECTNSFRCFNQVNGNDNTQTNECNSVGALCQNAAVGNDNIQTCPLRTDEFMLQ